MKSQTIGFKDFQDVLRKQFVKLDKVKRQKFLKYLITVPDFSEKRDIENYLDKIYLSNDDKGEKGAEALLKMVLTLPKDHKITFVEYLTNKLSEEDSKFVYSLLGSYETDGNIEENMEMDVLNKADDSKVDLNTIEEETSDVTLNELSNHKVEEDTEKVVGLERTGENKNDFERNQEDLLELFFKLEKESRWKFLKYLLLVPNIEEKKDIESFLDSVYVDNNEGDYKAEDFLKIVCNLENDNKSTFIKHLMRQLGDEDAAFISGIIVPNLEVEEHIAQEMEIKDIEEKNDLLLHKVDNDNVIELQEVQKEIIDPNADGILNNSDYKVYKNYYESDNLLIKIRPIVAKVVNIKNELEQKINSKSYEKKNIDIKAVKHPKDSQKVYIKSEKEEDLKTCKLEEDSKYFESDTLLIQVKKGLPLNIQEEMVTSCNLAENNKNYKKRMNSKNRKKIDSKRISKNILKPCPKNIFRCEKCCVGTETEERLQEHIRESHYNENEGDELLINKTTICDICSKQFKYPSQLRYHKIFDHFTERPFLCDQCTRTYKTDSHLKEHRRIVHEGGSKHKDTAGISQICDYCSKILKTRDTLNQHIKLMHTELDKLKCDKCYKSFNHKRSLEQHKFVHIGSKDFPCDYCTKLFYSNYKLKRHMKLHEGKLYTCNQCNKNFNTFSNFKTHERLHNGEKPHICDICQKEFAQKGNLKTHELKCKPSHMI